MTTRAKLYIASRCSLQPSGCWLWALSAGSHGYGNAWVDGRVVTAHTASYRAFKGEVPR